MGYVQAHSPCVLCCCGVVLMGQRQPVSNDHIGVSQAGLQSCGQLGNPALHHTIDLGTREASFSRNLEDVYAFLSWLRISVVEKKKTWLLQNCFFAGTSCDVIPHSHRSHSADREVSLLPPKVSKFLSGPGQRKHRTGRTDQPCVMMMRGRLLLKPQEVRVWGRKDSKVQVLSMESPSVYSLKTALGVWGLFILRSGCCSGSSVDTIQHRNEQNDDNMERFCPVIHSLSLLFELGKYKLCTHIHILDYWKD